jgi:uroporphyrinogen decarboxylase
MVVVASEWKETIARFEERTKAAMLASPQKKEYVKRAIRRQNTGRCPARLNRLSVDTIVRYGDDLTDLLCEYPDDLTGIAPYDMCIGYQPPEKKDKIDPIRVRLEDAEWTDEWGTRWGHRENSPGAHQMDHPIKDWSQLDDYLANRMPKADAPGRLDAAAADLAAYKGTKYCRATMLLLLYERLNCLRGAENVLIDLYSNENELRVLCDAILQYDLNLIRGWGKLGVDGLFVSEDWGTQKSMIISPVMWRRIFKPYYKEIIAEAHKFNIDVVLHSCGNVMAIIGDFIDIGLDILDPIQAAAMDINEVARQFGGHISFSGALNVKEMMAPYKPQQVKDMVRRTIDILAKPFGGGLIVSPDNMFTPELPFENIRAVVEACHEG